jgi:hypothetical protein
MKSTPPPIPQAKLAHTDKPSLEEGAVCVNLADGN